MLLFSQLLIHQQNSQIPISGNPPPSISPSNNHSSVSSVPTLLNTNFNNTISNVDTSINSPSSVNSATMVNSTSYSQAQNYLSALAIANPMNKSILSKQFLYQMHLLESAYRHPIIPLDSHRLKYVWILLLNYLYNLYNLGLLQKCSQMLQHLFRCLAIPTKFCHNLII